jgi:hypothetical protein
VLAHPVPLSKQGASHELVGSGGHCFGEDLAERSADGGSCLSRDIGIYLWAVS